MKTQLLLLTKLPAWRLAFTVLTAVLSPQQSIAGDKFDQDRARSMVESGQAISFASVQERLRKACQCQVLEAKLHDEHEHGVIRLVYKIKALRPNGQIVKLEMNATSGEILQIKNKGWKD